MNPPHSTSPPLASKYPNDDGVESGPSEEVDDRRPRIERGVSGDARWWRVGGDRVEMAPARGGWSATVHRADWGSGSLDLGAVFADEAEATAWCERMARALVGDAVDEGKG